MKPYTHDKQKYMGGVKRKNPSIMRKMRRFSSSCMREVSPGPLLSIYTFCSIQ